MSWQETWMWTIEFFFGSFRHFVSYKEIDESEEYQNALALEK